MIMMLIITFILLKMFLSSSLFFSLEKYLKHHYHVFFTAPVVWIVQKYDSFLIPWT